MNLIDIYVSEIVKDMPKKTGADIENEIRSTIQDMLEERAAECNQPIDDNMVFEILGEFGAPDKVAASYLGERYLIGPRLFPTFLQVLAVVLSLFGILALIGLGTQLGYSDMSVENVLEGIGGAISSLITVLGNVVLIFAFIEWILYRSGKLQALKRESAWDPHSLQKISPPNRVKIGSRIANIVLDLTALVLFNFYPNIIGFHTLREGVWEHYPLLTEAVSAFVPWLSLVWGLDIILNFIVIHQGYWKKHTRFTDIALRLAIIAILLIMVITPNIFTPTIETITTAGQFSTETAEILNQFILQGGVSILIIVILFEGLEIGKHLYRMIKQA